MEAELKLMSDENINDYLYRIFKLKDTVGYTWVEITEILNSETGMNLTPDGWRKRSYKILNEYENEDISKDFDALLEIRKEKVKLSDEKSQVNSIIRRLAREDTLKEIALSVADKFNNIKDLNSIGVEKYEHKRNIYSTNEAILQLSDWHYGIEIDNHFNFYNPDIARDRVRQLEKKVTEYCIQNCVDKIHVLNLGDLISGRIHLPLRINSRLDVITQIIEVSELIATFLSNLANKFTVDYYSTTDNHSRIEPLKENSLDLESLSRITDWFLKERIGNVVKINDNTFSDDIVTFNVMNHHIAGVHGDKDKQSKVIQNLSLMTKDNYDLILTAHLHHFSANEQNETLLISNGSMMGTDDYAFNLRFSSKPSQNLIICSKKNVCNALYRIVLE